MRVVLKLLKTTVRRDNLETDHPKPLKSVAIVMDYFRLSTSDFNVNMFLSSSNINRILKFFFLSTIVRSKS